MEKKDYIELLDSMDFSKNPENYHLDRVYDKEWFRNDLENIFKRYSENGSERFLTHQLGLWAVFLDGCLKGRFK